MENNKDLINLEKKIALPLLFDKENLGASFDSNLVTYLKYWEKTLLTNGLWKSLKIGSGENVDLWTYRNPNSVLYNGYQGIYWNDKKLLELISEHNIRPDVTMLHAGTIENEYIRTEGHEHLSGLPEIYETVYGENGYLLFKPSKENIEDIADVFFVFAGAGDHVLFPPGYQHISVNTGKEAFLMTDWVSTKANPDFKYIKGHNGAPYWVLREKNGEPKFERNPRYRGKVPEIRPVKPAEVVELSNGIKIKRGEPMFNLVREGKIEALDFLNVSSDSEIYEKAFVQ